MIENIRQCHENKARTAVGADAVSKAGRENDKAGYECDEGIQYGNVHGFPKKRSLFPDIAPEDSHRTDSEAECKKRLRHCAEQHIADAETCHPFEVRKKIKA